MTVGRDIGGIFAGDSYLSPRHATFSTRGSKIFVKDEVSLNGVYVKLAPEAAGRASIGRRVSHRAGDHSLRAALARRPPRPTVSNVSAARRRATSDGMSLLTGRDTTGNAYPVPEHGIHIGRERGDILFPEDGYVSGLHCRIGWESGRAFLTDLGSSNGTFARLYAEREVHDNDVLLMGQQLFRVNF